MKSINIPYATTIIMDYAWMASLWVVAYTISTFTSSYGSDAGYKEGRGWVDSEIVCIGAALCVAYALFVNISREQIFFLMFPKHFAKCKTDLTISDHMDYWKDVVVTSLYIIIIGYASARMGIMYCSFDVNHMWKTVLAVSSDYWLINLIKDNVSMRYIHPWMHRGENYWIHKRHHLGNKNLCTFPSAFLFDMLDLTIEFGIGPILGMVVRTQLLGMDPSIHVLAFMFSIWTDGNIHSLNPYTQAVGNPILDWCMHLTIAHNLHHALQKDPKYMTVFPMHQMFSPTSRKEDVALYNKIMKTNIDFRLFIDDEEPVDETKK